MGHWKNDVKSITSLFPTLYVQFLKKHKNIRLWYRRFRFRLKYYRVSSRRPRVYQGLCNIFTTACKFSFQPLLSQCSVIIRRLSCKQFNFQLSVKTLKNFDFNWFYWKFFIVILMARNQWIDKIWIAITFSKYRNNNKINDKVIIAATIVEYK